MATTRSGTMGTMHLVAAAMFLVIMSCTIIMPTTYAACDILRGKCNNKKCNMQTCEQWHGKQSFEKVYCKKTRLHNMCCCDIQVHAPPAGHHPSPPSHQLSPQAAV
ncbi:hypothetical protein HU200_016690 [Digitaria exilis]|uniref:Uncharacterized protein n=1 Tax=Digitaria exilis TaxID=1010633 RepID=A0A835KIE2_9POAL|nr:hypothetical protein HU200_016690 [Digitaria exilis]